MRLLVLALWAGLAWSAKSQEVSSPFNPCPVRCSEAGSDPRRWTHLHGLPALNRCELPLLFDTMLQTRLDDPNKHITLRVCTASEKSTIRRMEYDPTPFTFGAPERRSTELKSPACPKSLMESRNSTALSFHKWTTDSALPIARRSQDTMEAIKTLNKYLAEARDCEPTIMFSKVRDAVAGLYIGAEIKTSSVSSLMELVVGSAQDTTQDIGRIAVQNCQAVERKALSFGIVADFQGNITAIQDSLAGLNSAKCLEGSDSTEEWDEHEFSLLRAAEVTAPARNSTVLAQHEARSNLRPRAECQATEIFFGDTCPILARRCGISMGMLTEFNPKVNCNQLRTKEFVCCSPGDLPDFKPKPDADGNCHVYEVQGGDGCYDIADAHYLKEGDLDGFNGDTWGWAGCGDALQPGQKICLSKGKPPLPAEISNAECGPQKPGTGPPGPDEDLADLNPCPLNVCCNVWGQCGLTSDFCVKAPAKTGAPGTSLPGKNGCIANCGMNITNNRLPPKEFAHVAYFEAWNQERECLHMDVTDIDVRKYSHIHFAFPDITPGTFEIDVGKLREQFERMKRMIGIKRIVSLGGWAFSAEAPTYTIFREAVRPENRLRFATNVVNFVNEHNLDGIDFDWEYPAAPDLPGIPAGDPNEGDYYLEFLRLVKRRLPNRSVSIAAPASYWYLKGFPIEEISKVVDYIIYMTYDLHGQWDHGNKWSSPGCPTGDCLRSHINITETLDALAMVTKAGVEASKVFVGISSYGRSFKMAKAGCTGVDCKFTGTREKSYAAPGACTDTSGYISSAEIREILWNKELYNAKSWLDSDSDSDIVVYRNTEWIAWMNDKTKDMRIQRYKGLNFGGVSDWAVDLDKDYGSSGIGDGDGNSQSGGKTCPLSRSFDSLEELDEAEGISDDCKVVLAVQVLETMLDSSMDMFEDVDNGYDDKFDAYERVMKASADQALGEFRSWRRGPYTEYFDCDFSGSGETYEGPCTELQNNLPRLDSGIWFMTVTLRDEEGFWSALSEATGLTEDSVEFGTHVEELECHDTPGGTGSCSDWKLTIEGMPVFRDDFEIPNPKDIVEEIKPNLDDIRSSISAAFFDVGAGIWEGNNGDVVQVLSVPIFLLLQAVASMDEAKEIGEDALEEEKKNLILNILSAVLFFIPFVGQWAAMAVRLANVARMIAIAGMVGNAALTIQDVIENPDNAAMAIMGMLSGGRVRSSRDFNTLGTARRDMTKRGSGKMGDTFKRHDDTLQKLLGNCRREGNDDDDDEPIVCNVDDWVDFDLSGLVKRQARNCNHRTTTTKTNTVLTTPAITCSSRWSQACYHYSSVMSVHSRTPDMVRWTCWETESSYAGRATEDWGYKAEQANPPTHATQHHWEWIYEWAQDGTCDRDEWPPRAFWPAARRGQPGQLIRVIPMGQNRGAGSMWRQFCQVHDGYKEKRPGATELNTAKHTTISSRVVTSRNPGNNGQSLTITELEVNIPKAVFSIGHWQQNIAVDDGLSMNPCWPSRIIPDDAGFVLLTNDPWYRRNPAQAATNANYAAIPAQAVTSGITKYRTMPGRPRIGQRSVHWPVEIFGHKDAPDAVCVSDEDGEYLAGLSCGFEEGPWVHEIVSPSSPADTEAVPSPIPDGEEIVENATPGSSVEELSKPTSEV